MFGAVNIVVGTSVVGTSGVCKVVWKVVGKVVPRICIKILRTKVLYLFSILVAIISVIHQRSVRKLF